jgi:hypothetical protein
MMARISTASGYPGNGKGDDETGEGARGSIQAQDLLLLRLELFFGEDPLLLQRGELLELGRVVRGPAGAGAGASAAGGGACMAAMRRDVRRAVRRATLRPGPSVSSSF